MILTLSDDALVERLRKAYPQRRRLAPVFMLLGIALMAGGIWSADYFSKQALERIDKLGGSTDVEAAMNHLSFVTGVKMGLALASLTLGGAHLLIVGIAFLAGGRKDRLLIEYHRQVSERSIGRVAQPAVPAEAEPRRRGT